MRKTFLITGGSSGIGLTLAKQLSSQGSRVVLISNETELLHRAIQCLEGTDHLAISYDFNDIEHIDSIFEDLRRNSIRLDGMVYCAGIAPLCLLKDNTPKLMESVFRINLFSFIEMAKYFQQEEFSVEGARIVAVASNAAHSGGYRQTLYGSSKAALVSAVRLMAKELLNRKIRVNCVSPGAVESPMIKKLRTESANLDEKLRTIQPLGIIDPQYIARIIGYLLFDGADFLTGQEWMLDGGHGL